MKRKLHFLLAVGIGLTASVGWLHAQSGINSLAALKQAIQDAEPGATITLTADITDANTADQEISAISIDKPITLDGGGHSISGAAAKNIIQVTKWEGTNEAVTLQNLTITNTSNNGIVVYKLDPEQKVVLENVGLINNKAAGMILNASHVEAKNVRAHSNEWGSINLEGSDSDNVSDSLSLSLEGDCALAGPTQIWADYASKDSWFKADGWTAIPFTDGSKTKTAWTNKLSTDGKTYAVDFATELQAILGKINKGTTTVNKIVLNRDINISDLYVAQSNIDKFIGIINPQKTFTLDGQGHKISGTFLPADGSKSYYVIKLDQKSAGSTIQNLTIEETNATALDLITGSASIGTDTTVYVKNVNLYNNTGGGLNVNATAVVAENLHTRGNGHGVRITVDGSRGGGAANPHFTLKGNSQLEESVKIAYNAKENPATYNKPELARSIKDRLSFVTIETSDKANWKTTWQMANLSKSFNADNAVLAWTNDFDETSIAGKKLAKMTNAAELDSLFTFGGSTVDGILWKAADKQTLTKDITLDKSFAIVGNDTANCIVKGKWVIIPSDTVDVTLSSLKLTESTTTADSAAIINIDQPKVNLTLDNVKVDMQTVGHSKSNVLYKGEHAAIKIAPTVTSSTVELNNSKIQLGANNQVGFYNEGGSCNFTMERSEISVIEGKALSGVKAILAIGAAGATYNINNATLSVSNNFHYAVWIKSPEQHFVINNSEVYGWAAFYMQGAWYSQEGADGMTLKATHSSFTGVGKEGSSNGFGVIVFEGTERSVVEMDNCVVTSKIIDNTKDYGFVPPIVFQMGGGTGDIDRPSRKPSADCSVSLKNCTLQNMAEATTSVFVSYENVLEKESNGYLDYNRNIVSIDPNTKFLNADGSKSILIQNGDTLRNATKTLPNALIQFSKSYNDNNSIASSYKKPVAYPGDTVMVTNISMVLAVKSLNDSVPTLFAAPTTGGLKYITAPDSIVINCKDGYLVTGDEETAKAFAANANPDKLVFWLKQDTSATNNGIMFTKVAVGNQRLTIAGSVTINDANKASYNNRTIALAKDADLIINVPLVLDSVIFLTDTAQLTTTQNVTANVLQLNYLVKAGKWTAFGFPKGGTTGNLIVKKSGADEPLKFAAEQDADGIWQANVSVADGLLPQIKVKEANPQVLDSACIIATSGQDSLIVVTSPEQQTVSLSTKPEIGQPVLIKADEAQAAFSFVANPNTHPITLNKTAYVLNDEGTKFERTDGATIPAFGSYILADEGTTSTLRSLKIGDTPTGNEVIAVEGYFVRTGKGTIIIHTAEPVQVTVVDMLGRVYFNARVASDGYQISVPAGIYAVNRQKVIVK